MVEQLTVHVIDDDAAVRDSLGLLLEVEGFIVRTHASGAAFLRDARLDENCCLMVDLHMPGMSGLDLLARLRRAGPSIAAIVMTGMANDGIRRAIVQSGAILLEKPFRLPDIVHAIETAAARRLD
jgi:FixJ family two-component response regulator